jgi:dCTP deaminase
MSFWSSEKLLDALASNSLVPGYSTDRVKVGAYELSMGLEYFVTADAEGKRQHTKQQLENDEQFVIPQGQFALLLTEETLSIPADAIGFISIKASVKFRGLINVSGFHVDPGFHGRLKFSVYNAGPQPIVIARGQPVFLIWFSDLDRSTAHLYAGEHQNQDRITPDDVAKITGDVASPAQLKKDLEDLREKVNLYRNIALGVLTLLVIPLLRSNLEPIFGKRDALSSPQPVGSSAPPVPNARNLVSSPTPPSATPVPMLAPPPPALATPSAPNTPTAAATPRP